jgi:hypothetical protein
MQMRDADCSFGVGGAASRSRALQAILKAGDAFTTAVEGTAVKPGLALGSWAAFKRMGDHAVVMGDLVLAESEVAPVMAKLQQGGIEQNALHNHLLNESPHVMYLHIAGKGDPAQLATTLKQALALTKTPEAAPAQSQPPELGFDTAQIDKA